jgi:hypothetical protein
VGEGQRAEYRRQLFSVELSLAAHFMACCCECDPCSTCCRDGLGGRQVLGAVGALPDVFAELEINFFLLRRLLGVRSKEGEKQSKVGFTAGLRYSGSTPVRSTGQNAMHVPAHACSPAATQGSQAVSDSLSLKFDGCGRC